MHCMHAHSTHRRIGSVGGGGGGGGPLKFSRGALPQLNFTKKHMGNNQIRSSLLRTLNLLL